jgi:pimeloyl-ACP methyl ester carboxylesterase
MMQTFAMDDGARLCTWETGTHKTDRLPVVTVNGGPGLLNYLEPVAAMLGKLCQVYSYDQRGTGRSFWDGPHTIARHVRDLRQLLDWWGHERVVLVGHSYGTDLASFFLLNHPERVAGVIYLCGPFLGDWRASTRTTERARRTDAQQARIAYLGALPSRTTEEEIEFLALSWFTDHSDSQMAWEWAQIAAHAWRPVNYAMNAS